MADTTTELEVLDQIVDVLGGQSGQYETVVPVLQQIKELLAAGITDPEAIAEAVAAWLDEHPEATTTVQDGSITGVKIADGAVMNTKLAADVRSNVDAAGKIRTVVANRNLYDEVNNSVVVDSQSIRGTVYLNGYVGDIVISTEGPYAAYITNLSVVDTDGTDMGVSFGSTVYAAPLSNRQGRIVTIPDGAYAVSFTWRHTYSQGTLCSEMMVTESSDRYLFNTYCEYAQATELDGSGYLTATSDIVAYVAPDGSDDNDGLTPETALATIKKAVTVSRHVKMKRGLYSYNDSNYLYGIDGLIIQPYDNDETYEHTSPKRKKIVLNREEVIDAASTTVSDGLVTAQTAGGYKWNDVFISKTTAGVIDANLKLYQANLFVMYADVAKTTKLKPVLSTELCAAEVGTFYWDGTTVYCNIAESGFQSLVVCTSEMTTLTLHACSNVTIEDISALFGRSSSMIIKDCNNVHLINCEASYSATVMGYEVTNSDVMFDNCCAYHNVYDGFNFHGYGTTVINDCCSEYNGDDGCSHHDGCIGTINNGRFSHNGKCGIAPAYGAAVDISDVICEDNAQGIGYLSTNNGHAPMTGIVSSCALVGNTVGLSVNALCSVDAINCKYSGNTTDKAVVGTLREF